jgi:NAD(P)-dependent dehydrogenase (short-subunit alcohol dehydrogenase family)
MSRPLLSIYHLDRPALAELSVKLRELLGRDDRAGLAGLLGLGDELARRLAAARWAVDLLLRPDDEAEVAPFFACLRRVAKRSALQLVWTSDSPALEGRLRAYDVLRDEEEVAKKLDRILDSATLPWFLQRSGATGGWLDDTQRAELAQEMEALTPALPDEINAFVEALGGMDGDALLHDGL